MCEVTSHSRIEPKHYIYWNTVYVAQTLLSLNNKCKNNLDYNEIQVFFILFLLVLMMQFYQNILAQQRKL